MTDIREYSDAELSLLVFNDEDLYKMVRRTRSLRTVREYLDELFIYSEDQWVDLVETIEADREEDDEMETN